MTDSELRIGVISDTDAGAIRVPTAGVEDSVRAFTAWCNAQGGINGRKLRLVTYDAKLFNALPTMKAACEDDLFALVGSGSVLDAPGAQPMVDCGLVAVNAYTASYPASLSPNIVTPVPNPGNKFSMVAAKHIADTYPDAIKHAAIFSPSGGDAEAQADRIMQAGKKLGFNYTYVSHYPLIQSAWPTQVHAMKNRGITYVTVVDTASAVTSMLQAMADDDFHPIVDIGIQANDPSIPKAHGAQGVLVATNTQPFNEPNAAIRTYLAELHDVDPKASPTTLGVQAFSAGLLFATAAKALGSRLTRAGLLKELHTIHSWDGGGLHPTQDPGSNKMNPCVAYLVVKDGKFVRSWPNNGFACNPSLTIDVTGNWGNRPTAKRH